MMAATVVAGLLITQTILSLRIRGLRQQQTTLQEHAQASLRRGRQIEEVQRTHQEAIEDLDRWAAPLRIRRASVVLDGLLASRLPSIYLSEVQWSSGAMWGGTTPSTLQVSGTTHRLQSLSEFIRLVEENGGPRLEVRRSGLAEELSESGDQEFLLESIEERRPSL